MTWVGHWLVGVLFYAAAGWGLLVAAVAGHWLGARLLGLRGVLPTRDRSGSDVTRPKRSVIWLGGILAVYCLCAVCSLVGLLQTGKPEATRAVDVMHGMRAERAGMLNGDEVTSIDGVPVRNFEHLREIVMRHRETPVKVEVLRHGERRTFEVIPDTSGKIGVTSIERRGAWQTRELFGQSLLLPPRVWAGVTHSLWFAVTGREAAVLTGPVGTAKYIQQQAATNRPVVLALCTSTFALYLLPAELLLLVAYLWRRD